MLEHILTGPKIHYSELPPAQPGSRLAQEWETYRRDVARLLAEGHEGAHVLIHKDQIIGIFDRYAEAEREARRRFILEPHTFVIRQVLTYEPTLRTRLAG